MIEPDKYCSKCKRLKGFRDINIKKYPEWFNGAVPSIINKNSEILIVGLPLVLMAQIKLADHLQEIMQD